MVFLLTLGHSTLVLDDSPLGELVTPQGVSELQGPVTSFVFTVPAI